MDIDDSTIEGFRKGIRALEREIGNQLRNETSCCGVTVSQCHIMLELSERGTASLVDLEKCLRTDRSILSRVADTLVRIGYAPREPGREDRRYVSLSLTESGKEKAGVINRTCNRYYHELFARLPSGRHAVIMESICELAETMAAMRAADVSESCCGGTDE